VVEGFVQLLLEYRTELFELPDLSAFQCFDVGSGTASELLFVLIPIVFKLFEVILLLPEELAHLNIVSIEES